MGTLMKGPKPEFWKLMPSASRFRVRKMGVGSKKKQETIVRRDKVAMRGVAVEMSRRASEHIFLGGTRIRFSVRRPDGIL